MATNESTRYYIEKQFAQAENNAGNSFIVRSKEEKRYKLGLLETKLSYVQERLKKEVDPDSIKRCEDIINNLNMSILSLRKNINGK